MYKRCSRNGNFWTPRKGNYGVFERTIVQGYIWLKLGHFSKPVYEDLLIFLDLNILQMSLAKFLTNAKKKKKE